MCGIAITKFKNLPEVLEVQEDRGLDSVGIYTFNNPNDGNNYIYRVIRKNLNKYKKYLNLLDENPDNLCIFHHRKASIGNVHIDNAHPFKGKKFYLIQNGTNTAFYNTYKNIYKKETDSETLLSYIEERADKIKEVPDILDALSKRFISGFGIIILIDLNGNILFYSDGKRESYIEIDNDKVIEIRNYKNNFKYGYENIGYILFKKDGTILKNEIKNINEDVFVDYTTYTYNKKDHKYNYDYYDNRNWDDTYSYNKSLLKKETKENIDDESVYIEEFILDNYQYVANLSRDSALREYLMWAYNIFDVFDYYKMFEKAFPINAFSKMRDIYFNY